MIGTGSVAGFTGDVDLRPRGRIAVLGKVVIVPQIGGMAVGAHVVPRLVSSRPMQRIGVRQLLIGVEVEPALAVVLLAPRIPRHNKALYSTVGEGNQVLLQGRDPERIRKLKVLQFAVGAVGADVELAVFLEEAGRYAVFGEVCVVEIPEDGGIIGDLHCLGVVRSAPGLHLLRMALYATLLPNVGGGRRRLRFLSMHSGEPAPDTQRAQSGHDKANRDGANRTRLSRFAFCTHGTVAQLSTPGRTVYTNSSWPGSRLQRPTPALGPTRGHVFTDSGSEIQMCASALPRESPGLGR